MNLSHIIAAFGTLSLINFARKTKEKLRQAVEPEVVALADLIETAMSDLQLAYSARRPLVSLWSAATRVKEAANSALDTMIAALSYDLLSPALLNKNRRHSDYLSLFPEGNIDFIHGPDRQEVVQVAAMVAYLKATPTHPMASRATELELKNDALDSALGPATAAEAALRSAWTLERDKRQALGRTLCKVKALLHAHFMDKEKEESFFPTIAESKVEEDEISAAVE